LSNPMLSLATVAITLLFKYAVPNTAWDVLFEKAPLGLGLKCPDDRGRTYMDCSARS
jgi:hypothetical protein